MNICLVLISDGWGGAENVVFNLAKHLSNKGENVSILLNNELFNYFSDLKNVDIFRMPSLYNTKTLITSILSSKKTSIKYNHIWCSGPFYFLNSILRGLYYKKIHKNILYTLKQQKIDIVHLHLENPLRLFMGLFEKLNLPVVITLHSYGAFTRRVFLRGRKLHAQSLVKADKITCVSKYVMNQLEHSGIPTQKKPIVIPNGVDISEIRKTSKRILKGDFKLFFPGGSKLWKGGDLLVESLSIIKREIPSLHLYVTGNVPQKNVIRKIVGNNKLERNVSLLGFLDPNKNLEVFNSTDLLVFPSKGEASPIVLLEAMALGKPIVTTKVGGIPEVVKDMRNGIFVERHPRAIAEAVVYLFKNKEVYEEMSLNNLKDAEKFDWKKIVDKYVEVYKMCTSSKD